MENENPPTPLIDALSQSSGIGKIFESLGKAQAEMKPAILDMVNPHYSSRYASLTSCQDAYRIPLSRHGLALVQQVYSNDQGYFIKTILGHSSGEFISNTFKLLIDKQNMQGLGSAISYGRRYGVSSLIGVVDTEDDDGNAASVGRPAKQPEPKPIKSATPLGPTNPPTGINLSGAQLARLFAIASERKWTQDEVRDYMRLKWNLESTKGLVRAQYDELVGTIQALTYDQAVNTVPTSEPKQ